MSRPTLSAQPRAIAGKAVKRLRSDGLLPAVVYGAARDSQAIQLDAHEFELLRRRAGRNVLVDLALDGGKPQPVLVHDIQEHPVTRRTLHVDFLAVNMTEERTVDVPISTIGHSEAVERLGGVLLHLRDTVQVRALPDDLPSALELDISSLDSFDAVLHASDLRVPAGVQLVTDPGEAVARVQPPRVEEEPTTVAEGEEGVEAEAAQETGEAEPGEPPADSATPAGEQPAE
ncbi:MAG TPA: 50S ribosomal protein L25 [Candidatus Limnocylindria bacterium]|jgi:large subunit ribosomal protein L25|nr:50S ribosomal protein L25 [Candidatus Limnocylindria bacterium]